MSKIEKLFTHTMLGMQDEAHKEFPDEAPPHASVFAFSTIVNTFSEFVLQEIISLGDRGPRFIGGSVDPKPDRGIASHRRRLQATAGGRESPKANWVKLAQ
jgi:hypothetical protein